MPRRIDIELTSALADSSWTWRAAGARVPKGVLDGGLLPDGAKVGDVLKVEVEQELDGSNLVHRMQQLAQDPHTLQFVLGGEQFFTPRAGATNIDGGVNTFFRNLAIQVQFHVACTFEFLKNHFVHFGARLGECS